MRRFLFVLIGLVVLGGVAAMSGAAGYYVNKWRIEPVYGLAERAEGKIRRELDLPSETVDMVARIETIFLNFRGTVYPVPENDFQNGGALALWGDDVLVMNKWGRIHYLDPDAQALLVADITVPDNGREGYARIAEEKYPGRTTRIDALRYNDLEFIDVPERRGFLLSYTFVDVENECYRSRIDWVPVARDMSSIRDISIVAEDWDTVFETSPCLAFNESGSLMLAYMAGGRMAFKEPNLLYLGSGEYHLEGIYRPDAGIQSDDSDYGKTIEIDLETGEYRHYSKGHRNLQGVTLDLQGRLWTTEHGMRGGDELNLIRDGENYGWPVENLGTLYSGVPAPSPSGPGRHETYAPPIFAWLPSAAVSSLAVVNGLDETWDGDILIGSLKGRTLFRARIQDERLVALEEIPIGQRIRDVMQIGPNRIALWLDTLELVILEVEEREDPLEGMQEGLVTAGMAPDLAGRVHGTLEGCAECHSFEKDIHGAGPSLYRVYERSVASTGFGNYSSALSAVGGAWNADRLATYLEDPAGTVEGTTMTGLGVGDPELAQGLVQAFEWLKERQPKDVSLY